MTIRERVKRMLGFGRKEPEPDHFDAALMMVREIGERAEHVNRQLQPYVEAPDPFSMLVSDMYNADQMSRAYQGPPR